MVIKLNRPEASAPALDRSGRPSVDGDGCNPRSAKIVALDADRERRSEVEGRSDSQTLRFHLGDQLEAMLARSLNLIVSRAVEAKARECADAPHANVIESGLSRRPSEFFPEAA